MIVTSAIVYYFTEYYSLKRAIVLFRVAISHLTSFEVTDFTVYPTQILKFDQSLDKNSRRDFDVRYADGIIRMILFFREERLKES